jgi:hypothetical protein
MISPHQGRRRSTSLQFSHAYKENKDDLLTTQQSYVGLGIDIVPTISHCLAPAEVTLLCPPRRLQREVACFPCATEPRQLLTFTNAPEGDAPAMKDDLDNI